MTIALPCLVIFSNLVGWIGGALIASWNTAIDIPVSTFLGNLGETVRLKDVLHGIIKSFAFAVVVATVCCHQGLVTQGGPRGIGRSVTKAVVNSFVFILILDYVLTRILLPFDK